MSEINFTSSLMIIFTFAFAGGIIAKKFKLPVLLGYIVTGTLIGTLAAQLGYIWADLEIITQLGAALLLFTLGLEFSFSKLKEMGGSVLLATALQILLMIILGLLIFPLFGMDFYTSIFLGSVFSLSSSTLAGKILYDKGDLDSHHGEISIGWLFMQDLYTIPMTVLLITIGKILTSNIFGWLPFWEVIKSITLSLILFFSVIYLGKKVVPQIIEKIAGFKSRELLLIGSIIICLLFSLLFQVIGFSFVIGSFIAGILISSSSVKHGIFAEIRPLKDVFSLIFFVSIGFLLNPLFLSQNWLVIFLLTSIVLVLKFIITSGLLMMLRFHPKVVFMSATSITSVGEFAIILATLAQSSNLISQTTYLTILSVTLISIIICAPLMDKSAKLYYLLTKFLTNYFPLTKKFLYQPGISGYKSENKSLTDHVVVLGYGRVGKYICRALSFVQIPYLVVDYNHRVVKSLREEGIPVIYGDPAETDVLLFANVKYAKVLILAYSDRQNQEHIVTSALTLSPNLKLLARTHHEEDQKKLKSLGCDLVIQPEFEASITIAEKLLRVFNIEQGLIDSKIHRLKIEHGLS